MNPPHFIRQYISPHRLALPVLAAWFAQGAWGQSVLSPANTVISANPWLIAPNGASTSTITVQAVDSSGANMTNSQGPVTLSTTLGTLSAVTDQGNGSYAATLTSTHSPGTATVSGTIAGAPIGHNASVLFEASFQCSDSAALDTGSGTANHGNPIYIGGFGDGYGRYWAEFSFQLPSLGAQTNPFTSAALAFNVVGSQYNNSYGWQVSPLVGLTTNGIALTRAAGTVLGADNNLAATNLDLSIGYGDHTALGLYTDNGPNLLNYLNSAYNGGAGAGQYVFFQIRASGGLMWWKGFWVADHTDPANHPLIYYRANDLNHTNVPPVLPVLADVTVNEMQLLVVTNTASDTNLPPVQLTYMLLNPPAGASIDTNGVIRWAPSEAQGPGNYTLTTVVTDNSPTPLSATNTCKVTVNEVNLPPVLPVQYNRAVAPGTPLVVVNTAADPDLPVEPLTYTLLNPPAGASIDTNGVITWIPTYAQDYTTNVFTTVVTDFSPTAVNAINLSATNSFSVFVTDMSTGNLLTENPSFENTGGWFGNGPYAFDGWQGQNWRYNGNYVAGGGTDGSQHFHFDYGGYIQTAASNCPAIVPGAVYKLTYDLQTPYQNGHAGWLGTYSYLEFLDDAGNVLKQYWGPDGRPWVQADGIYPWQSIAVQGVAPAGATHVRAHVNVPSGAYPNEDSRSADIDNFSIVRVGEALDRIGIRRAPKLVQPGQSVTLALKTATLGLRYLGVRLLNAAGTAQASLALPVNPGRNLNYVSFPVPSSLPNGTYSWQVELLSQPAAWDQSVACRTVAGVFCDQTVSLAPGGGNSFDADHTNLVYMGRWNSSDPKKRWMDWYGSEVRLRFSGTSLTLRGGCGDNGYGGPAPADLLVLVDATDNYLDASYPTNYVDVTLGQENGTFLLASGLAPGIHTARLFKSGESDQQIHVDGFLVDSGCGLLRPEPLPNRRVEVYGDSVTSGGSASPGYLGYAPLLGCELGADLHVISKGGTGVAASFSGLDILLHYFNNLAFPNAFDASQGGKWDFSQWTADAVLIAIGHNDQFNGGTANFGTNYWQLSDALRTNYPNAPLLSINTVISCPIYLFDPAISPICAHDTNHFLAMQLNTWTDPNTGHPPTAAHQAMVYGDAWRLSLADYVEAKCGWGLDAPLGGYERWVVSQFTPSEIGQGLHSPGISVGTGGGANLLRYALGISAHGMLPPGSAVVAGLDGAGRFTVSFPRAQADVNYFVEVSDDLVSWQNAATNPGTVGATAVYTDPTWPLVSHRFARLRVAPAW